MSTIYTITIKLLDHLDNKAQPTPQTKYGNYTPDQSFTIQMSNPMNDALVYDSTINLLNNYYWNYVVENRGQASISITHNDQDIPIALKKIPLMYVQMLQYLADCRLAIDIDPKQHFDNIMLILDGKDIRTKKTLYSPTGQPVERVELVPRTEIVNPPPKTESTQQETTTTPSKQNTSIIGALIGAGLLFGLFAVSKSKA